MIIQLAVVHLLNELLILCVVIAFKPFLIKHKFEKS